MVMLAGAGPVPVRTPNGGMNVRTPNGGMNVRTQNGGNVRAVKPYTCEWCYNAIADGHRARPCTSYRDHD